jgi:hydroxypyruvate isomerase
MLKLSANLTMLFNEVDFLGRFDRAAKAGFRAVEFMFPYAYEKAQLADELGRNGLELVLFNLPAGDWEAGERGIAVLPGREEEFRRGVDRALAYAKELGVTRVNCLVGLTPPSVPLDRVQATLAENLRYAAETLGGEGIRLLLEPLNTRDMKGFHLSRSSDTLRLIDQVRHPNLFLQYDVYHMQVMEGDVTETIRRNVGRIGHIQIADNPGRHEPGTGELNYPNLFRFIDEAGYDGYVGCEYRPLGTTEEGLAWAQPYLSGPT